MRSCVTLLLLSTALACAPASDRPVGPAVASLPAVFPSPDQLVDDRLVVSDPDARTIDTWSPGAPEVTVAVADTGPSSPEVTVAVPEPPRALVGRMDAGTLMYPTVMAAKGALSFYTEQKIKADALAQAVEILDAPSKEDLVAWRTEVQPFVIEAIPDHLGNTGNSWLIIPKVPFKTGHWYRVKVAAYLSGEGTLPLGSDLLAFVRGPEPLRATDVSCGWPSCTLEDRWSVSFNGEVDEASLPGCITTVPALDLGKLSVEGWSVYFQPTNAKVGSEYKVRVTDRCKNLAGDRLTAPYEAKVKVELPRARLGLPNGTGYIAPGKNGAPPVVVASAAYTGKLTIGTRRIDRASLPQFLAENLESWGGFSFAAVEPERTVTIAAAGSDAGQVDVKLPLGPSLKGAHGIVYLSVTAEKIDENDDAPMRQAVVQVTELGLSVKTGPVETLVWVTSLVDHLPVAGVDVVGIDAAGKELWKAKTDERGMAIAASPKMADGEGVRAVIASRGDDVAFLDMSEYSTRLEPYEFGLPYSYDAKPDALRGIVFTERGVYRAGETVHVKGFVRVEKAGKLERLTAKTISIGITNPIGDVVLTTDLPLGEVGDFEVDLPLGDEASLGSWRIESGVKEGANGQVVGGFRVEAYRANTFEVKVDDVAITTVPLVSAAPQPGVAVVPGATTSHVSAKALGRYYYGAPMAEANARWWINRANADFSPTGYSDYRFEVPSWSDDYWEPQDNSVESLVTGEGVLDGDGYLAIDADLTTLTAALESGPQALQLEVEVTDVDQQTVTGRTSTRIESADHYLGVRAATTFAGVGETVEVDAIALTPDGQPAIGKAFEVRWISRSWESKRIVTAGGGHSWEYTSKETVIDHRPMTSSTGPVRVSFVPKRSGLYWIEAEGKDAKGRTMKTREDVWVWGDGATWNEGNQGHVELIAAQPRYKVGDKARFVMQSPFGAAHALVTVEANGIIHREVKKLEGSAPLVEFTVTEGMMPNAFVSVVAIGVPLKPTRPGEAEARIGYARMQVDTGDKKLALKVTPDQATHAPGEPMTVRIDVTDAAGMPLDGQVTFMAVDEGVLSLTGYRTPDPHKAMFTERALAIMTSESRRQMWTHLVVDDGSMKSDWGGGGEGGEATNYRNAFATTAAFFPDVVVKGGKAEVRFDLPDNLTTFRLMAVAATTDGRYGQGESKVEVRKPLLVRPGLPRFLSVGDRFEARAVVQALAPELAGAAEVKISVSGPIVLEAGDSRRISAGIKATPVTFAARATEPGIATFAFTVTSDKDRSKPADAVQVEIPVHWPAAKRSAVSSGVVGVHEPRASTTLEIPAWVRDDVGGIEVTLTSTRLGDLLPGLDYLLKYPYGCVEQTTGGTLPLLALNELQSGFELPGIGKDQVLVRAQAGVDRLRTMQTYSGGLGYWPGETSPHPWGSVYGGMALIRASKVPGLDVPASTIERLSSYLREMLRDTAATAHEEWRSEIEVVKPFAAYVLALAGKPEPAFHATMFEKRKDLPDFSKLLLALAINEAKGDKAMADTLLDEVLATVRVDGDSASLERTGDRYYYSTMDSDVRSMALLAMALEALRPNDPVFAKIQKGLLEAREGGHWESTQDNAFAVLALARTFVRTENPDASFVARVEVDGQVWLEEAMRGNDVSPKTLTLPMYVARKAHGKKLTISRSGDDAVVYFSLRFDYAPAEVPKKEVFAGFQIARTYKIATGPRAGQLAASVAPGDLVRVDLFVQTSEARRYVAIDDQLPAGLEPVTLDFATTRSTLGDLTDDGRDPWRYEYFNHQEQRDDRVMLFADVMPSGTHRYTYLARATTAGSFLAPAARVHEMYHPDVHGQTAATGLVVQ